MTTLPAELRDLIESGPLTPGPRDHDAVLNPYATLRARAVVESSDDTWDLLNRLAKIYIRPDSEFPAPKGPGFIVRYTIERIGGVGPWA